jgi:multidrug efflux pump
VSQALTLYTTPVIYIFFDKLAQRFAHKSDEAAPNADTEPSGAS